MCMKNRPTALRSCNPSKGGASAAERRPSSSSRSWSSQLARDKAHLRLLDQFDHVFIYRARPAFPTCAKFTTAPCSSSSRPARIALRRRPSLPMTPPDGIDVYRMGRRLDTAHEQLFQMAQNGARSSMSTTSAAGCTSMTSLGPSFLTLNYIKRSRYFTAYSLDAGPKALESVGEQAIARPVSSRVPLAARILLGTPPGAPNCPELFDWPDAVVEIPQKSIPRTCAPSTGISRPGSQNA